MAPVDSKMATKSIKLDGLMLAEDSPHETRIFTILLAFYTVLVIALPTGNVFGLNVKMLAFVPLILSVLSRSIRQTLNPYWLMSALVGIPFFFSFWVFLSQAEQYELAFSFLQYRNLLITLAGCWFVAVFIAGSARRRLFFVRLVLWSVLAMSVLKLLIMAYCLARGVPVSTVINAIGDAFGIKLMSFELESADPDAIGSRIMFTSDLLIAPCCFAVIALRRHLGLNRIATLVFLLFYLVSLGFSFSRFHWAYCGVAIVFGFLVARKEKTVMLLLVACLAGSIYFIPALSDIVALRFSDKLVSASDAPRHEQILSLNRFFGNAPILGHGWGTFPHDLIRSDLLPYSYEVELLALLGQIGVLGVASLLVLAAWYFRSLWPSQRKGAGYKLAVFCLLAIFISGGFTNPMLLTSISSVSYGLLRALGDFHDDEISPLVT